VLPLDLDSRPVAANRATRSPVSQHAGAIAMADRKSLGLVGYMLGGMTAVVIGVGIFIVQGHLKERYVLDAPAVSTSVRS
jgi:hypothetical protein